MSRCAVVTAGHLSRDHIAAVEGRQGTVTVERRCADVAEVVAVVRAGWADAALLIGSTEEVTATLLEQLRPADVTVVVISDVASERRRLGRLGVCALPDEVETDTLLGALRGTLELPDPEQEPSVAETDEETDLEADLEADLDAGSELGTETVPEPVDDGSGTARDAAPTASAPGASEVVTDLPSEPLPTTEAPERRGETERSRGAAASEASQDAEGPDGPDGPDGSAESDDEVRPSADGSDEEVDESRPRGILTVWGAHGSPGRTTLAVNLAAELAADGDRVLLVDADTVASSAAAHLGLLEESAGLAQACRQAELGRLTPHRLSRCATAVDVAGGRLHLLTGIPRAERWRELREHGLREVLRLAREEYEVVVVDVASPIEHDEELTYDTQAPQRHSAGLTALRCSDRVLAVGAADPVGFTRLVRALEDYGLSVPEAPRPTVVVNRMRREVVGRDPERHLHQAWRHFGTDRPIDHMLPWDPEACDGALRYGRALGEVAPDSPLRRGVAEIAGMPSPRPSGLWGRMSAAVSGTLPHPRGGGLRGAVGRRSARR